MKIGLFGGSFDPVHLGHTSIATAAQEALHLDQVHFIPCIKSPHKAASTGASVAQRCAMIGLAIADLPWARISRVELERDGPSYSWQTAAWYRSTYPGTDLFWILGSDQWEKIESWANPAYLQRTLHFVVFPRGAEPGPRPGYRMTPLPVRHPASSTRIRESFIEEHLDSKVAHYIRQHELY